MQRKTQELVRLAIQAPPKFAAQLSQSTEIVLALLKNLVERVEAYMPRCLVAIAKYMLNSQKFVKWMQDLAGVAVKKKKQ